MPKPNPTTRTQLCPYCGQELQPPNNTHCSACSGHLDPLSKQATQNHMGPWYIRDQNAPFRPGCSYQVIRALTLKGKLDPESPVRGPTTMQFWKRADETPGLAHLLGNCHNCRFITKPTDKKCPSCGADFQPETNRQYLGLGALRPLPGRHET